MRTADVQQLLCEGIAAAKAVQEKRQSQTPSLNSANSQDFLTNQAYQLLMQVTELDETNVQAWLWLSTVVDTLDDKCTCLNNILTVDPHHQLAKMGLDLLNKQRSMNRFSAQSHQASPTIHYSSQSPANHPNTNNQALSCPFCEWLITATDTHCPHCTLPLLVDCPACNLPTNVEWAHCCTCGSEMGDYRFGAIYFTQLATAYRTHQALNKALDALSVAERIMPDLPDLHRFIGEIQAELGQTGTAITTLKRAIQQEPDQAGPYLMLGQVLQKENRWQEAEEVYLQAVKAVPQSSEPYFALGELFLQQKRLKQAWTYLQKTLQLDPEHGLAWTRLGQIYESQQKVASAIRVYQQAITVLDPESTYGQEILERLHACQR